MLLFKERTMAEDSTYVTMQHIATGLTPLFVFLCQCSVTQPEQWRNRVLFEN